VDADRSLSDTSSRGGLSEQFSDLLRRFTVPFSLRFQFNFGVIEFFGKRWKAGHRAERQWFGFFVLYGVRLGQLL